MGGTQPPPVRYGIHRLTGSPEVVALGHLPGDPALVATARLLGGHIRTQDAAQSAALAAAAGAGGLTFLFRFGAAVTFAPEGQPFAALESHLRPFIEEPPDFPESETVRLAIGAGGDDRIAPDGGIVLSDARQERLLLVATVLSRSVVLARDEMLVSEAFDRAAPIVADLRENGRARLPIRAVMKLVGEVLAARHRVTGTVQVGERPDLLWDHPELDRLYARLEGEYELKERAGELERKLDALGDFGTILADIVQDKRAFRLEAAIIALIALEIVLNLAGAIG